MKRMLITLAAAAGLGLFAGKAAADPGGYAPPSGKPGGAMSPGQIGGPNTLLGAGDLPPGRGPDCYGFHPGIKRFARLFQRSKGDCAKGDCGPRLGHGGLGHGGLGHGGLGQGGYGGGQQGGHGHNPLRDPANWAAGGYGQGGPAYNPTGFPPGANPMMQGTLVFPNHPFVRSPRDYFFGQMGLDEVRGSP